MAVVASSSLATSVVRWHHHHQHHHPLLFISPSIPHRHRCRQSLAAQPIRAFGRSDLDGFARRVASGEALRDAWRTANDGIELLAFEARRAAERIDRRFSVSRRFDSLARAASVRAREIDQELGIGRRWRSFSLDFSRNWPRYRKDLSDFLETPLGRGFAVARLFPVTRYFDKQKLNTRGIVKTIFFLWFALSGWLFRFFILATWVLPFAAPLLIATFANNFAIEGSCPACRRRFVGNRNQVIRCTSCRNIVWQPRDDYSKGKGHSASKASDPDIIDIEIEEK